MNLPFDTGSTPIAFTNTADEECPPHAALACHGFEYDATNRALKLKCRKPTAEDVGSDETIYAFNGPTKVAAGKPGACVMARHAAQWARVDPEYDFGEFDEAEDYFVLRIGPVAGQWHVSRDGEGFVLVGLRDVAGAIHEGRVLVLQDLRASDQARVAYITQDDGSGNAVPCYSSDAGMTVPFACNSELDGSGREYEVYWSYQPGVRLTGEAIYIAKRKRPAGNVMQWEPVDAGVSAWPQAVAVGNITSGTGTARITHWGISCEVDVVWFDPTFTVQDGATIYVTFDQESGIFIGHMTSCPPDP